MLTWGPIVLRALFTGMLTWGPIVLQSLHLPHQTKPFQPSQSKVLCTKERDDIRPQTKNVRAPVICGLYCPSSSGGLRGVLTGLQPGAPTFRGPPTSKSVEKSNV